MPRPEDNAALMGHATELATKMEAATRLSGDGASVIRELVNALANLEQADKFVELIAGRYEHLVEAQDALLQENLRLQRELVRLAVRVVKLEGQNDDGPQNPGP